MRSFLSTLKQRNAVLYYSGWVCLAGTLLGVGLALFTQGQILGINAFVKPTKFFISIALFCWTMGWFTGLLDQPRNVAIYSWVVVVTMLIELIIITGQAAIGKQSHFNIATVDDARLFQIMGLAITVLTLWTAYIGYLFFRYPPAGLAPGYLWGIRLGILVFVLFAFEGVVMAIQLAHTVGAPDGGPGLPVLNWSTGHGDLRAAHFFGMHALQLIPLFSYYVARRPLQVMAFAGLYTGLVTLLLVQALAGKPLWATITYMQSVI